MCENCQDGLDKVNELRACLELAEIKRPWHNRYFSQGEIMEFSEDGGVLEKIEHISSTYAFLSRVLNAGLSRDSNVEPKYDAPINKLALKLPSFGEIGQTKIWVWNTAGASS